MLKIKHNKVRMTAKRLHVYNAALFHAITLGISDVDATIRINFIKGYIKSHKVMADCRPLENKTILINIDPDLNGHNINCCIAHEMIHAKQYLTGELGYNRKGEHTWNKKTPKKGTLYYQTPWEIEAMSKEILMAHTYNTFAESVK